MLLCVTVIVLSSAWVMSWMCLRVNISKVYNYIEECGWKNASLWNFSFELVLCRCCVSKSCSYSFASLDVVCTEFSVRCVHDFVTDSRCSMPCSCQVLQSLCVLVVAFGWSLLRWYCLCCAMLCQWCGLFRIRIL